MPEYLFGGINERPDGTFSITPHMPLGRIDEDFLEAVTTVARRFNLPGGTIKILIADNYSINMTGAVTKVAAGRLSGEIFYD